MIADARGRPLHGPEVATELVPPGFTTALAEIGLLLSRETSYDGAFKAVQPQAALPVQVACVVVCTDSACGDSSVRCLAFATRSRGHLRWYGVTHAQQDPAELWGVKLYVPVHEVIRDLRRVAAM